MSDALSVLFPSLHSPTSHENIKKENFYSSPSFHALSSLLIATILGTGVALATYFSIPDIFIGSIVIGVSTSFVVGTISYVAFRFLLPNLDKESNLVERSLAYKQQTLNKPSPQLPQTLASNTPPSIQITTNAPREWGSFVITQKHLYPGDLDNTVKSKLDLTDIDRKTFQIKFNSNSPSVTICRKNIFNETDLIVNAANPALCGGGGIDGAIHKEGGPDYKNEHQVELKGQFERYEEGYAAMIGSGDLKRKYNIDNVIVVAGPSFKITGNRASKIAKKGLDRVNALKKPIVTEKEKGELYSCYYNSLVLAHYHNKTSIAFTPISTGEFRFPKEEAAKISLRAIHDFINNFPNSTLKKITIHYQKESEKIMESYKTATSISE